MIASPATIGSYKKSVWISCSAVIEVNLLQLRKQMAGILQVEECGLAFAILWLQGGDRQLIALGRNFYPQELDSEIETILPAEKHPNRQIKNGLALFVTQVLLWGRASGAECEGNPWCYVYPSLFLTGFSDLCWHESSVYPKFLETDCQLFDKYTRFAFIQLDM